MGWSKMLRIVFRIKISKQRTLHFLIYLKILELLDGQLPGQSKLNSY